MTATVNDQSITITDESLTVSESVGIYECDFTFDASWNTWNKTAVFEGAGSTIEMIVVDNKAQIPWEVLKEAGWIKIGVYGTKGGEVKPTIWSDQIYVAAGTVPGSIIVTPTPSIYAQILDLANDAKDIAEDAQDTADDVASDWASVSATATTLSAGSPATVTFADNTFTFGIPKGAKGDTGATGATGATPDFSIGTVSTLETGQSATATITGTAAQPVLNLGLPKGNKGDNGDVANVADAYSTSATYAVGDYCIYSSQLYRCTTAITTAEAWTAAHWAAVQLGDDTSDLRSALTSETEAREAADEALEASIEEIVDESLNDKADIVVNTASGSIASFTDGAAMPVKSLAVNIDAVQSGTGDPSPTNVRPITGWDAVKVTRCGENIFGIPDGTYSLSTTQLVANGGVYSLQNMSQYPLGVTTLLSENMVNTIWSDGLEFKPETYIFNVGIISLEGTTGVTVNSLLLKNKVTGASKYISPNTPTTLTEPHNLVAINATLTGGFPAGAKINYTININVGATALPYEPYNGQTVTIQLGQTVYGGTLDVLTGVLTVDKAVVEFDGSEDEAWTRAGTYQGFYHYQETMKPGTRQSGAANWLKIIDGLNERGIWLGVNNRIIYVNYIDDLLTESTVEDWHAYLASNPLQVLYPLATPLTIQLTAEQLSTIKGTNNIFANAGDVSVQYGADTKIYIEDSIIAPSFSTIAPIENGATASQAYTTGQYFLHNNVFCKAKTSIASGATFTLNTNYEETTIAAELYAALH